MPTLSAHSMTLALQEILCKAPEEFGLESSSPPHSSTTSPGLSSGSSSGTSSAGASPVIGTSEQGTMAAGEAWDDPCVSFLLLMCPRNDCQKQFATEDQLDMHLRRNGGKKCA